MNSRMSGLQDDVLIGLTRFPPKMDWDSLFELPPWRAVLLARLAYAAGAIGRKERDVVVREATITGGSGQLKPWRLRTDREKSEGVHSPWKRGTDE